MKTLEVNMVKLPAMRVASAYGFGPSPEEVAWAKLAAWAQPKGYLSNREQHRIFGFNNPNPSPLSPNYGYEFWMEVGPEEMPEGEIRIVDFAGGHYAVTDCPVPKENFDVIGETWKRLVYWREHSSYQYGAHQWLEKHVETDDPALAFRLQLYMPVSGG